jgi:hypothetical protein
MSLPDWKIISECMDHYREDENIDFEYIMRQYSVPGHIAKYLAAKVKDELRAEKMGEER